MGCLDHTAVSLAAMLWCTDLPQALRERLAMLAEEHRHTGHLLEEARLSASAADKLARQRCEEAEAAQVTGSPARHGDGIWSGRVETDVGADGKRTRCTRKFTWNISHHLRCSRSKPIS